MELICTVLSIMAHRGSVLTIYRYINPFLVHNLSKVNWALSFVYSLVEKLRPKKDFTMFLFCKVSCWISRVSVVGVPPLAGLVPHAPSTPTTALVPLQHAYIWDLKKPVSLLFIAGVLLESWWDSLASAVNLYLYTLLATPSFSGNIS